MACCDEITLPDLSDANCSNIAPIIAALQIIENALCIGCMGATTYLKDTGYTTADGVHIHTIYVIQDFPGNIVGATTVPRTSIQLGAGNYQVNWCFNVSHANNATAPRADTVHVWNDDGAVALIANTNAHNLRVVNTNESLSTMLCLTGRFVIGVATNISFRTSWTLFGTANLSINGFNDPVTNSARRHPGFIELRQVG